MWSLPHSALLLSALTAPQAQQTSCLQELKDSAHGVVHVMKDGVKDSKSEMLPARLTRLESSIAKTIGQLDLKLRAYMGSSGSVRHWIGSYNEGTTKFTALFEERPDGKGYSGFDLRLNQIRINLSEGDNRERINITLYGNDGYIGYATHHTIDNQTALYGGTRLSKDLSFDFGVVSNGDKRARFLRSTPKNQVSATIGVDQNGNDIGSLSVNSNSTWFIAQGGRAVPSSYRLTFGAIDHERSQRASAFLDGGLNEAFPNAATYKITAGDDPTFHLIRRVPGQFLGMKPGDGALDILYTPNTSLDLSGGIRLKNKDLFVSPYIGARFQRDLRTNTNRFGMEIGSFLHNKDTELRARVEYTDRTKQTSFGLLLTKKLK